MAFFTIKNTLSDVLNTNADKIGFTNIQSMIDGVDDGNVLLFEQASEQWKPVSVSAAITQNGLQSTAAFNLDNYAKVSTMNTPGSWSNITNAFVQELNEIDGCSFENGSLVLPAGKFLVLMQAGFSIDNVADVIGTNAMAFVDPITSNPVIISGVSKTESLYENLSQLYINDVLTLPTQTTLNFQIFSDQPLSFYGSTLDTVPARSSRLMIVKLR